MLTVILLAVALMVILPLIMFYFSPKIAALENERRELKGDLYSLYFQSRADQIVKSKRPPIALHSEYGKSLYWNKDIMTKLDILKNTQAIGDIAEKIGEKISDTKSEPKQDYPRGGIVSGKDLFDALHRDKPEMIVPPNKIKELLNEPQYINSSMDLESAEIAARNKRYSSYQIARGWVVPNEDKNWWGVLLRPAYKIMIPRTTGKTITDISTAVGNYRQNN